MYFGTFFELETYVSCTYINVGGIVEIGIDWIGIFGFKETLCIVSLFYKCGRFSRLYKYLNVI